MKTVTLSPKALESRSRSVGQNREGLRHDGKMINGYSNLERVIYMPTDRGRNAFVLAIYALATLCGSDG
jgi:hypothetical protein